MTKDQLLVHATWRAEPPAGKRDVAHISMWANDQLLTRLVDFERKEERDYVRASAVSLAFWFADNWWRLRHESLPDDGPPSANWRLRHEMTSASGGTVWPPIMIHSTGDRLLFTSAYGGAVDVGAVRYRLPEVTSVAGDTFEAGLDGFFDVVIGSCARSLDAEALRVLLQDLESERGDPEASAWRRLEARLGYDADTVPEAVMKALGKLEKTVGEAVLQEAASATPGKDAAKTLQKALAATAESEVVVDLGVANDISRTRIREQAAPPWQLGREAAYQVREAAGLQDGRIGSSAFSELFRVRSEDLKKPGTARGLPYSAHARVRGEKKRVALQSAHLRDRRFELACVLGDQIWTGSDFGLVTKAKTDRQKFQRAFAQNLLVPYADLRKHIDPSGPTQDQMEHAAGYFHVHPNVIKRLLILEGVLPEETFEQRLEAA